MRRSQLFFLVTLFGLSYEEGPPSKSERNNESKQPNIIFILADDLGFNDVPWHNPEVVAPNLKALAEGGVILEQSYVQPICTPTRSALLTGTYPFAIGRQRGVLWPMMPTGLTLKSKIIPEFLKPLGYSTHAIGKWHVGFCKWDYTPTERGFDTFRGYYTGSEDYYTKVRSYFAEQETVGEFYKGEGKPVASGFDYRNNKEVYYNATNIYSTYDYADHFESVVRTRNESSPLFVYMAFQSVHSPLEVPKEYIKPYAHIKDRNRRTYLGMVSALDEAVGRIYKALVHSGIYENSVIIFSTDNGGPTITGGNNWPLRGNKTTLWEGGTRGAAFVNSPLLPRKGITSHQLVHTTDWLATIVSLAGGEVPAEVDGVDQMEALLGNNEVSRKEIVYNIDHVDKKLNAGIRYGRFKLLVGNPGPGEWTPPPESEEKRHLNSQMKNAQKRKTNKILDFNRKKISKSLRRCKRNQSCLEHLRHLLRKRLTALEKKKHLWRKMAKMANRLMKKIQGDHESSTSESNRLKRSVHTLESMPHFEDELTNMTASTQKDFDSIDGLMSGKIVLRLYDLKNDPEERHNLESSMKSTVKMLLQRLLAHMSRYVSPDNPPMDQKGNPKYWNGVWSPGWC